MKKTTTPAPPVRTRRIAETPLPDVWFIDIHTCPVPAQREHPQALNLADACRVFKTSPERLTELWTNYYHGQPANRWPGIGIPLEREVVALRRAGMAQVTADYAAILASLGQIGLAMTTAMDWTRSEGIDAPTEAAAVGAFHELRKLIELLVVQRVHRDAADIIRNAGREYR